MSAFNGSYKSYKFNLRAYVIEEMEKKYPTEFSSALKKICKDPNKPTTNERRIVAFAIALKHKDSIERRYVKLLYNEEESTLLIKDNGEVIGIDFFEGTLITLKSDMVVGKRSYYPKIYEMLRQFYYRCKKDGVVFAFIPSEDIKDWVLGESELRAGDVYMPSWSGKATKDYPIVVVDCE